MLIHLLERISISLTPLKRICELTKEQKALLFRLEHFKDGLPVPLYLGGR